MFHGSSVAAAPMYTTPCFTRLVYGNMWNFDAKSDSDAVTSHNKKLLCYTKGLDLGVSLAQLVGGMDVQPNT